MKGWKGALPACLLALLLAGGVAPLHASTPGELFEQANDAYEKKRFDEAVSSYETILKYGVADPRVLYNLGNAYFMLGKLAPAILNYERALRIDPADADTRENLELARSRIRDRVLEPDAPFPVQALQQVLDAISPNAMAWIVLGFWVLVTSLAALLLVARDAMRRRLLVYSLLAGGLCALLAAGGLAFKVHQAMAREAIVMLDRVDVRSGPGEDNTVLFTVHEGTSLELRNRLDGWFQVSLPNALSGWVAAASVEEV
jgi:tetratricopeptide (TPR) repeat protein